MPVVWTEPTVEVLQFSLEGNKVKNGVHKQMEKLVKCIYKKLLGSQVTWL